MNNLFFAVLIGISNVSFAQLQAAEMREENFSAIVQYSKGSKEFDFKDVIPFDKSIEVPEGAYIKVITQKRCTAVFYEKSKIQSPKDRVSPWQILSGTVRWICQEDKTERLSYKDSEIQIQKGELLLNGAQLNILKNTVRFQDKNLQSSTLYIYKNKKWLPLKNQPDPYDLWKKEEKFPAPLESIRSTTEKPHDPYVTRVFLNIAPVGASGLFNHEDSGMDHYNLSTHAFRIGANFPLKKKSILVFLEYNQGETDNNDMGNGPLPVGYESAKFEATTLGLGLRHNHIRSSSFYYYLGLTHQKYKTHSHPTTMEYYDARVTYPLNISGGGGYQKIFWAKSWVSLMVGVDLKIIQSLTSGKVDSTNQPFGQNKDPRSLLTEYSGFLYLGPVFNF